MSAAGPLLVARGLAVRLGARTVLDGVALEVRPGELIALAGPNGAGKTSLFNIVSGYVRHDAGTILLNGHAIEKLPMHARARLGVSRTWQNIRLFPSLSVLDNLMIAPRQYSGESILRVALHPSRSLVATQFFDGPAAWDSWKT